jgi:hypothetical protein
MPYCRSRTPCCSFTISSDPTVPSRGSSSDLAGAGCCCRAGHPAPLLPLLLTLRHRAQRVEVGSAVLLLSAAVIVHRMLLLELLQDLRPLKRQAAAAGLKCCKLRCWG